LSRNLRRPRRFRLVDVAQALVPALGAADFSLPIAGFSQRFFLVVALPPGGAGGFACPSRSSPSSPAPPASRTANGAPAINP
ncbi:MAG: hypothetical protein ACRD8O_06480, partial [Bryobacteraceae bacterium]